MYKFFVFRYFVFVSGFHAGFIRYVDFTRIAGSNIANDDVTN